MRGLLNIDYVRLQDRGLQE